MSTDGVGGADSRRRYWLDHSEGFAVEQSGRRLGIVESAVRSDGRVTTLNVLGGFFGNRRMTIPVDLVGEIDAIRSVIELRLPSTRAPERSDRAECGLIAAFGRRLGGAWTR
jgi:hypothetical protein